MPEPQKESAAADPLAELIAEYRRQNVEFTKRAPHEDWTALTAETYGPPLDLLWHHTPEPNSPAGVLAALLLAKDEPDLYALESINEACIRYLRRASQ
ncbi:hypothetical protein [Bosea sp. UC22_33]|uniref:hypothetical protein n=1 Tax=Bosea sp. UC22_33 TaxID=3350165 RepID=UPI00366EC667